jgi:hypothetical protein
VNFAQFKAARLAELYAEPWGDKRIPDLVEVFEVVRPKSVLEIGCYQGVSTEFWLLHCKRVVAVDPWPDTVVRQAFLARCSHYPHLTMVEGFSPSALRACPNEPFDMVYIDGDHSYEAVRRDIETSVELFHPAWVAGHDYGGDCPGVAQAVNELLGDPPHKFSDGSWAVKR